MAGILVKYTIDKDYFELGKAYRIRLSSNNFKHCLLIEVSDDKVKFAYYDKGNLSVIEYNISDLRFRDLWIVKLKEDYKDGKFSVED